MAEPPRIVERGAILVPRFQLAARVEQQPHHVGSAEASSNNEWCRAVSPPRLHVRPCAQESPHTLDPPTLASGVQSAPPISRGRFD
eukprot:scaffold5691_cov25-Tisochrysis_lutea.AAC.2